MSIELYRQFRRTRRTLPPSGKMMPYDWVTFPEPLPGICLIYVAMLNDFALEISNAVNAFTDDIEKLKAWSVVTAAMTPEQKMKAAREFVDALGTQLLGAPYMIRSRFIYAVAHLCHQASCTLGKKDWKDDLPTDNKIDFSSADKSGAPWRGYKAMKRNLEKIGGKVFREDTKDFRNAYNHRFPPRLMYGFTNFASRQIDRMNGDVRYVIGDTPPLQLDTMVNALSVERDHAYSAFDTFQALVREHVAAITRHVNV